MEVELLVEKKTNWFSMTSFGCWNIMGFNNPVKQREIQELMHNRKLCVMGVVETKVADQNKQVIHSTLFRDWSVVDNNDLV